MGKKKLDLILGLALLVFGLTLFLSTGSEVGLAYVASSASYRIDNDTFSVGGLLATSTSYIEQSTVPSGITTGTSTGVSYAGAFGYLQAGLASISISNSGSVSLSPNINLSGGGQSSGSTVITITTDSSNGYSLYLNAATSPAFSSSNDNFLDYVTAVSNVPDFTWSVGSGTTGFGFSPEGADITSLYKDNGSTCNAGSSDTADRCWNSLSASLKKVAQSSSANSPGGTATTIKFMAEAGSSVQKIVGSYGATIVVTAVAL